MKKIIAIISFVVICFNVTAQPSDAYIHGIMTAGHIPGVEAVVIKDGKWIYNQSWGKADISNNKDVTRQTIFMMASISKTVIATALMQLWQRGSFRLDDNINNYLPFTIHNPNHPTDIITFRMLATHTSAIQDNYTVLDNSYVYGDSPVSLDSFLRNYLLPGGIYYDASKNFYTYRSGTGYNYSNVGATLAAYLVQAITGDDYSHYCDTAIFEKLCMNNTSLKLAGIADTTLIARPYSWNGTGYDDDGLYGYPDYPDGQLRTNITALARFMTMYMQYGIYNGTRILDSTTVITMMKDQYTGLPGQGIIFGEHLFSNGDTAWGHNGGDAGVSTTMNFNYKTKTGVIVFTNADIQSSNNVETIADTLYRYGLTVTPAATDTFPPCSVTTGIRPLAVNNEFSVRVFPNPASELLHINLSGVASGPYTLCVTNAIGALVISPVQSQKDNTDISISSLAPGFYLLSVQKGSEKAVIKFVKN